MTIVDEPGQIAILAQANLNLYLDPGHAALFLLYSVYLILFYNDYQFGTLFMTLKLRMKYHLEFAVLIASMSGFM